MRAHLGVLAMAAVLAGCSSGSGQPDDAEAISGAFETPSARVPNDPIPAVRNPKNLIAMQPCLLLTPVQLDTNRIDQAGQPKSVLGNTGCEWSDKAHTRQFAVYADIGNDVLRNVYSQREDIPVFELTEVAGLPAIRTKDDVDGTSCYFRIAVADMQTLIVRFTSLRQTREDPCPPAKQFAQTVIGNLPPLTG
ncbi:MAG TPA: DUF3558 domain-containing protein [Pseudonocardiaceae bacterium]|jgi:hypothetical protein